MNFLAVRSLPRPPCPCRSWRCILCTRHTGNWRDRLFTPLGAPRFYATWPGLNAYTACAPPGFCLRRQSIWAWAWGPWALPLKTVCADHHGKCFICGWPRALFPQFLAQRGPSGMEPCPAVAAGLLAAARSPCILGWAMLIPCRVFWHRALSTPPPSRCCASACLRWWAFRGRNCASFSSASKNHGHTHNRPSIQQKGWITSLFSYMPCRQHSGERPGSLRPFLSVYTAASSSRLSRWITSG